MFAVLIIPNFSLQAVLRLAAAGPAGGGRPSRDRGMAVMTGDPAAASSTDSAGSPQAGSGQARSRQAVVLQCNADAESAGVAPGLTAPQAMARCPGIELHARSESAEASARTATLAAAWTLSPRVEDTAPGVCTIDLRGHPEVTGPGCAQAGKIGVLARAAIACLEALGLSGRIGIARTPRIARYAALSTGSGQAEVTEAQFLVGRVPSPGAPTRAGSGDPAYSNMAQAPAIVSESGSPRSSAVAKAMADTSSAGSSITGSRRGRATASQASALRAHPSLQAPEGTATRSTSEEPVYSDVARVSDPRRQVVGSTGSRSARDLPYGEPVQIVGAGDADERAFLAPLPIELADPSEEQAAVLAGWGVKTLGELTALPRAEAAMRLGEEGAALWDRAAGRERRVLRHAEPPRAFEAEIEFEDGIETLEPLLFLLRRFCDQLALQLAAAGFAAAGLHLVLTLGDGKYARDFRLPAPTGDAGVFFRVLHTHLETLKTETPVVALRLAVTPTRPLHRQQGLFDSSLVDPHGLNETLARVGAVVGSERVGAPVLENTHRPDAVRLESVPDRVAWLPERGKAERCGLPLRRYRPPRPARVETEDGRPVWVLAEGVAGPVVAAEGPWRGSGEWWSAGAWSRDEWDVEIGGAGLHRIFESAGQWFVEGEYD